MFDLAEHLPAQRPARERWPFLAAAVLASYAILYLAHVRGTRWLRMMIWPVAPAGALWFWLTVDLKYSEWPQNPGRDTGRVGADGRNDVLDRSKSGPSSLIVRQGRREECIILVKRCCR